MIVGAPEGVESFGGADLDEVVLAHVRDALGPAWEELDPADPDVLAAVADLRRAVIAAKEALSHDTEVLVPVALPGVRTQVRLGRAEFEEMIRPALTETVEAMRRALDGAGDEPGGPRGAGAGRRLVADPAGAAAAVGGVRARRDGGAGPVGVVAVGAALVAAGVRRPVPAAEARAGARPPVAGGRTPASPAAAAPVASARAAERPVAASPGPGTLPLAAAAGSPDGTEVLAVARPPKQARPFLATHRRRTSRPRRIALFASAGALALAVLGGAVAFGIERVGCRPRGGCRDAGGSSDGHLGAPPSVTMVPVETPAPKPPRRLRRRVGAPAPHRRRARHRPRHDGAAPPRRRRGSRRRDRPAAGDHGTGERRRWRER